MKTSVVIRLLRRYARIVLYFVITILLSARSKPLFEKYPDYKWIADVGLLLYLAYNIHKMTFRKTYVYPFLKIICVLFLLMVIHEFYSLPLLVVDAIHLPDSWTPNIFIEVMITVLFFILFFVLKLLSYKEMEIYYLTNTKNGLGDIEKTNDQEETTLNSALTYPLSIMIVMFLMFLRWRVTDFKMDELREMLVQGDYLAFPIAVIVLSVLFYILVQLMHSIFLMMGRMTSQKIVAFLNASDHALKLTEKVSQILKLIVGIILDTILTTLAFVKFIPDFFTAMQKMVLEEDEEDGEEGTVEGKHTESRKGPEDTEPKET